MCTRLSILNLQSPSIIHVLFRRAVFLLITSKVMLRMKRKMCMKYEDEGGYEKSHFKSHLNKTEDKCNKKD